MLNQTSLNSSGTVFLLSNAALNWYTDKINLYVIVPMGAFGAVFNLTSFVIFCKKSYMKLTLFKYMRVYAFVSLILSSSCIFFFSTAPYSLYKVALSYEARIFNCEITQPVIAGLFFYSNVLEIFINIERALCFRTGYERFKKVPPYIICLILLVVCAVVHSPNYFILEIVKDNELPEMLKYCKLTKFWASSLGKITLMICYILEGPVVVTLVVITNVISVISFKKYLKRKSNLRIRTTQPSRNRNTENSEKKQIERKNEKRDKQLLYMTFNLSLFSIGVHIVQIVSLFIYVIYPMSPTVSAWFVCCNTFVCVLKVFSNIFFFYRYNIRFRNSLFCLN